MLPSLGVEGGEGLNGRLQTLPAPLHPLLAPRAGGVELMGQENISCNNGRLSDSSINESMIFSTGFMRMS